VDAKDAEVGSDGATSVPGELGAALLVASPRLGDPNFTRTVVLVLDHGDHGALGVVLNRPTSFDVAEVLEPWHPVAEAAPPATVFRGGPVSPDAVIGLARAAPGSDPAGRWHAVLGPVGTVDLAVAPDDQPVAVSGVRLFAGYAGWTSGQLEAEIEEGGWFVVGAEPGDVFTHVPERLWHDTLRRQSGELGLLAAYPLHPSLN
jgi:putative transcriptional regulator